MQANVLLLVPELIFSCSSQHFVCSSKMVLHWNCLRINIHESIHVKLKSEVTMKPLQLCIFIHDFLSFCICFFLVLIFWCFNCKNLQRIFPPISDNNSFYFSIRFLISIFYAFIHLTSNSLCPGVISRLIFVLFPIRDICFYSTVKNIIFFTNFPSLGHFFGSYQFLNDVIACSFPIFYHWVTR